MVHTPAPHVVLITEELTKEVEALTALLPEALSRQWEPSPIPRPRDDTTERSQGGAPNRPVEEIALDPRRLKVREAVHASLAASYALRKARRDLEKAIARFDGEKA